uniref:Zona pellucida binding protein 2 n=1 Tax=Ornithorhynchus anatinus TaxID=9258 RepID=A0A6I8P172_ORNAN
MARDWVLFSAVLWALTRVKIYVKVHHNSPFLACMDLELSQTEIIDPSYLWIGPDGRNIKGQSKMNITETGKLMVKNFQESLSGSYTCTLSYQNIKTEMQTEEEILNTYEFMLFVNPFAPGWEVACDQVSVDCEDVTNGKIQQAKDHLEEFFRKQSYVLKHEFHHVPAIHYVDHSFQVTRIDSCRPGFGKNDITHSDCASCCVACDPGTYSPNTDVTCRTCSSAQIYGSKSCQTEKINHKIKDK